MRIGDKTLIPCWSQPALHIGRFTLYSHGIFLALGAIVSSVIFVKRAETFSLSKRAALGLILCLASIGLLASHLTYSIFEDRSSLLVPEGISSLGGILACLFGLAIFTVGRHEPRWRCFDAAAYAGVVGALIARLGCFLAHDRIGLRTSSWFSVSCFDGSRYDLALLEVVFLVFGLALLICVEQQGWRPFEGMTFSVVAVSYGLLRLVLGQLSERTGRYAGLLPEQFGAAILLAAGACSWLMAKRNAREASALSFEKHRS